MSMVRCCGCNKPMDTDAPGSIYADGEDLYCLGCHERHVREQYEVSEMGRDDRVSNPFIEDP